MSLPPGRSPWPTDESVQQTEPAPVEPQDSLREEDDAGHVAMVSTEDGSEAEPPEALDAPAEYAEPEQQPGQTMKRVRHVGWELAQTLVLALVIFMGVRAMAQNFRVEGSSMEPGLHDGQYLLVNKAVYFRLNFHTLSKFIPFIDAGDKPERYLFHGPHRGDVIVFRYPLDPSRDFIKRVIGIPGDTVEIAGGQVSVNGVKLEESYINQNTSCGSQCTIVVPEGHYFVLGDNRPNSSDSRAWGLLPEENIIGQAMFSYWPFDSFGGVGNHSVNLGLIKIPLPF